MLSYDLKHNKLICQIYYIILKPWLIEYLKSPRNAKNTLGGDFLEDWYD